MAPRFAYRPLRDDDDEVVEDTFCVLVQGECVGHVRSFRSFDTTLRSATRWRGAGFNWNTRREAASAVWARQEISSTE